MNDATIPTTTNIPDGFREVTTVFVQGSPARHLLMLAGIQTVKDKQGKLYAPGWAVAIVNVRNPNTQKTLAALRGCARDEDLRKWVDVLCGCARDDNERDMVVAELQQDLGRTVRCMCGAKFESARMWREHLDECATRRGKL